MSEIKARCAALGKKRLEMVSYDAAQEIRTLRALLKMALPYIEFGGENCESPGGYAAELARNIRVSMLCAPPGPPNYWRKMFGPDPVIRISDLWSYCACPCHSGGGMKHIMACCHTCPRCKQRIEGNLEAHRKGCTA